MGFYNRTPSPVILTLLDRYLKRLACITNDKTTCGIAAVYTLRWNITEIELKQMEETWPLLRMSYAYELSHLEICYGELCDNIKIKRKEAMQ